MRSEPSYTHKRLLAEMHRADVCEKLYLPHKSGSMFAPGPSTVKALAVALKGLYYEKMDYSGDSGVACLCPFMTDWLDLFHRSRCARRRRVDIYCGIVFVQRIGLCLIPKVSADVTE